MKRRKTRRNWFFESLEQERLRTRINPKTERMRLRLYEAQGGVCAICGQKMGRSKVTIEHVTPRKAGGHRPGNIVAAHAKCNNRKAARPPTGCELIWLAAVNKKLGEQHGI